MKVTGSLVSMAVIAIAALVAGYGSSHHGESVCEASQLTGKQRSLGGAAGTILFSIVLQNHGSACTLRGYPGLQIVNAERTLPTRVVRGGFSVLNQKPERVDLGHLSKATVYVSYSDVPVGAEKSCPAGTALLVRPPGASGSLTVPADTGACDRETLHESPIIAGVRSPP
jgi:hypothetical protein